MTQGSAIVDRYLARTPKSADTETIGRAFNGGAVLFFVALVGTFSLP